MSKEIIVFILYIVRNSFKRAIVPYAGKEGPDQTAHLRSLIRAFRCPLTESVDIVEYIDEGRRPRPDCAVAQAYADIRCLNMV